MFERSFEDLELEYVLFLFILFLFEYLEKKKLFLGLVNLRTSSTSIRVDQLNVGPPVLKYELPPVVQ